MTALFLSESPIHVIDALSIAIGVDDFSEDTALLAFSLFGFIDNMERFDDHSVAQLAMTSARTTINSCRAFRRSADRRRVAKFVAIFKTENGVRIRNDLAMYTRRLENIYRQAGVEIHRDV